MVLTIRLCGTIGHVLRFLHTNLNVVYSAAFSNVRVRAMYFRHTCIISHCLIRFTNRLRSKTGLARRIVFRYRSYFCGQFEHIFGMFQDGEVLRRPVPP